MASVLPVKSISPFVASQKSHSIVFLTIVNCGYYMFVAPFRISCSDSGEYIINTNKLQKFICGVLHLCNISSCLVKVIGSFQKKYDTNPVEYLHTLLDVFTLVALVYYRMLVSNSANWTYTMNYVKSLDEKLASRNWTLQEKGIVSFVRV